jgi:outer membrane lipoprotein
MINWFRFFLLFPLIIFTLGCAHVISNDLRARADLSLSFSQVHQNPEAYKGKFVVWGGEIIETLNQKDGTTQIEVFQRPLNWRGEPKKTLVSEGRFLILAEKYLDPYFYRKGTKITVAGEIQGEKIKPVGEMDYRYPLLLSKELYLWEEYYYPVYSYYPFYYYDPWWGYPLWWRYHLYYHRRF